MEFEQTAIQDDAIRLAREQFRRTDAAPSRVSFEKMPPPLPPQRRSGQQPKRFTGGFFNGIQQDKDTILLLGLILLLCADGGDRMLILALVYIMS